MFGYGNFSFSVWVMLGSVDEPYVGLCGRALSWTLWMSLQRHSCVGLYHCGDCLVILLVLVWASGSVWILHFSPFLFSPYQGVLGVF